ncbi:adhesive plaque matrix protein-like [Penaeus chinensis]|uniref:adhesive plaque matrix protein-like n=1 Tax=Penaeus chinensis TaxID=139456 RepID=UPI001FB82CA7|nr:adhesive plaque matrix protein-like [Penaeus chinensis]
MFVKIVVVFVLVTIAVVAPSQPAYGYALESAYEELAKHDFNYAVRDDYSGNDFGHQEARNDYNTQGSYYVLLPDGRLQKVTYTVNGDSGYVVEVSYEGEPQYPEYKPAPVYEPVPAYKPVPVYESAPAYKPGPAYETAPAYEPAPVHEPAPAYKSATAYEPVPVYTPSPAYEPAPSYKPNPAYV